MANLVKRRGKAPKKAQIARLVKWLKKADSVVLADLSPLKVSGVTKLRRDLRQADGGMMVVKNRLAKLALEKVGYPSLDPLLKGPTAMAFGIGDPSVPAKLILALKKDVEAIKIKGGVLEGIVLDIDGVVTLSTMPGRPELLSRLIGSLNAPIQKVVFALNQAQGKIVYAIEAYRRQLEEAEG